MQHYALARDVTIHTDASGESGLFGNAFLIESAAGVVAVDASLSGTESKALRKELAGRARHAAASRSCRGYHQPGAPGFAQDHRNAAGTRFDA